MKSNDLTNREDARLAMQKALAENNSEAYAQALDSMMEAIAENVKKEYDQKLNDFREENDIKVLQSRGVRQLTGAEKQFYQKFGEAVKAHDPKQALTNANLALPTTVMDAVFDELQTRHPLLSRIDFVPSGGAVKMLMNTTGYQEAVWGQLCDDIVKEIIAGFEEVSTDLLKLSAFIPVCKAVIELGPEWLDDFVRQTLYEVLANGLEAGIVKGDGNGKPIGMNRQVGAGVSVVGGVYPEKEQITVTDLTPNTIGNLLGLLAVDANGKPRALRDVVLLVNPQDYYTKVMPATTLMAADGTYRNDVLPYPMQIIQVAALNPGEAILGIAYKYFAAAGMDRAGRIEYSDHYQFLEDARTYLIKLYANGFPMDNNAFLYLNIENLAPAAMRVEMITPATASNVATLASLRVGGLALTPAFASGTDTYTVTTTNNTNTITAVPSDAGAEVEIAVNGAEIANGSAAVWNTGSNTVTVTVTRR